MILQCAATAPYETVGRPDRGDPPPPPPKDKHNAAQLNLSGSRCYLRFDGFTNNKRFWPTTILIQLTASAAGCSYKGGGALATALLGVIRLFAMAAAIFEPHYRKAAILKSA